MSTPTTTTSTPPSRNHDNIVQTHTYDDRVDTIGKAKSAGLSPCSGLIAGLGETDEQLVEALFALKALESDSIPVNFLMPFDGTPFENTWELSPIRCLKILAMARFVCPDKEIRIAGGREMHLRSLQALALHVANSIFLGDYLTSEGQDAKADIEMIKRQRVRDPRRRGRVRGSATTRTTPPSVTGAPGPRSPRTHERVTTSPTADLLAFDREHLWHPYASMTDPTPVRLVTGADGVRLRLARRRARSSTRCRRGGPPSTATATRCSTRRSPSRSTGSAT